MCLKSKLWSQALSWLLPRNYIAITAQLLGLFAWIVILGPLSQLEIKRLKAVITKIHQHMQRSQRKEMFMDRRFDALEKRSSERNTRHSVHFLSPRQNRSQIENPEKNVWNVKLDEMTLASETKTFHKKSHSNIEFYWFSVLTNNYSAFYWLELVTAQ